MVFVGSSYGVLAGEVSEIFARDVRYTGTSLCYHLSGALGGGLGPVIATGLLSETGSVWPVAVFSAVISLLMAIACIALPRRESHARSVLEAEA
jgi:hypothetical protein